MSGNGLGWGGFSNQVQASSTGGGTQFVGDVSTTVSTGKDFGGSGFVNRFSGVPPVPPAILGFLLLETGVLEYLLLENGDRIQLE